MDINEFAQWAVLAFLGIFVLGLTRQLGFFLVPRGQADGEIGPDVGKPLPRELLGRYAHERLRELIAAREHASAGAILVIDEACSDCRDTLERLAASPRPDLPVVGLLTGTHEPDFRARAEQVFDFVADDPEGERSEKAGISGTPFLVVVDDGLVVRDIGLGRRTEAKLSEWLSGDQVASPPLTILEEVGR
jgi:hypothetical protein